MHGQTKPRGVSLHIGLNQVDSTHYAGWRGTLAACENDACDLQAIAASQGFATNVLLSKAATSTAVLAAIQKAADELVEDDFFLLTYSGHGGQINDATSDEPDGLDETWALYDRQVLDDEFYQTYSNFRPGVRVFVLSDSCHCGLVTKAMFFDPAPFLSAVEVRVHATPGSDLRAKCLPPEVQLRLYKERSGLYDDLRRKTARRDKTNVECCVLLISACQNNQVTMDSKKNGLFTEALLKIWDKGNFRGGYHQFRNQIAALMPPTQSPKYSIIGHRSRAFERQKPFTIAVERVAAAA